MVYLSEEESGATNHAAHPASPSQISDTVAAEVAPSADTLQSAESEQPVPDTAKAEAIRPGSQGAKLSRAINDKDSKPTQPDAVESDVKQQAYAPSTSAASQAPDAVSPPTSVSPFAQADNPPLLTSVTTASDLSSDVNARSGSSTPASFSHAPSTAQRSCSAAPSQVSDSDITYTSNLISAASMGAQSGQAPSSQAASLDGDQTDRLASNAEASTSRAGKQAHVQQAGVRRLPPAPGQGEGVSADWQEHSKHVLILSNAGKPIWSLHGDENSLAGLMAVIQALVSFVHDRGDTMRAVKAGRHNIVFLERGSFILVMASAQGEPDAMLLQQLSLVHDQVISILSSSVEKMFARNPSYDMRKLLGATSHVLASLVHAFDTDPSALLTSIIPLPLKSSLRHQALVALRSAVKSAGAVFGVLLTQQAVVAVAHTRAHMLHPHDLLLLANLIRSNESFRQAQTFTPICLPQFNASAFLHSYVQYLSNEAGLCLVLLSAQPESFFAMAEAAQQLEQQLQHTGVLQSIAGQIHSQPSCGLLDLATLPPACGGGPRELSPLLHFLYKSPSRAQVIMPRWHAPLDSLQMQQATMQRYASVGNAMSGSTWSSKERQLRHGHSAATPAAVTAPQQPPIQQQVHWAADGRMSVLAFAGPEYELYAVFDAATSKDEAVKISHRVSVWVKGQQTDLLMPL